MLTINNCDSQMTLYKQEIYSPKWLILCVMMHAMCDIAYTATDMANFSKIKLVKISSNGKITSSNPLVFTTTGETAPQCTQVNKRLAEKIAQKHREPYISVITYIKIEQSSDLPFWGAPLLQYEAFAVNGVMLTSRISQTLISVWFIGPRFC